MDKEVEVNLEDVFDAPALPSPATMYESPANVAGGVDKVSYTHLDMIDFILTNPAVSQKELAQRYGYTQGWVSRILSSDAFRAMYSKRKTEMVDPIVAQELDERFRALAMRSIDVVMEKLDSAPTLDGGLKALEVAGRLAGYGVSKGPSVQVNTQVNANVVVVPAKSKDAAEWLADYKVHPAA